MILYLDTSVFVALLVEEPTTARCQQIWNRAERVCTTRLLYAEAVAALARANREGRLTAPQMVAAVDLVEDYWREMDVIDFDDTLMRAAGRCAVEFGLRGYDAVHCAAGLRLAGEEVVAASGDQLLLEAWGRLGLATFDPATGR